MDYKDFIKYLSKYSVSTSLDTEIYSGITTWLNWYKGVVKDVHQVKVANGVNIVKRDIYTLKMAKRVCEDWASSLCNEDITINVKDAKAKAFLGSNNQTGVLGTNKFNHMINEVLERTFALGTSAIVVDFKDVLVDTEGNIKSTENSKIVLNNYDATRILPISWNNNKDITEVAFITKTVHNGKEAYVIATHLLDENDEYVIHYDLVNDKGNNLNQSENTITVIKTHSKRPFFMIIKTSCNNSISFDSPLGQSVYADAIDVLKAVDYVYDSCVRDVISGQRLILMNKMLLGTDEFGNTITPQDGKQYYMQFFGDEANTDVKEWIKEFTPKLNTAELDKELQNQLNMLSFKCGLGTRYYNFDRATGVTATEYTGERQDFVKNAKKASNHLRDNIIEFIRTLLYIGKDILGKNLNKDTQIEVVLADGFIEDDGKEREQDRQDVKDGLMTVEEYRAKWHKVGNTEE